MLLFTRQGERPRSPLQEFLEHEAASGLLLILATVLALIAANSPLAGAYQALLHVPIRLGFGPVLIDKPLLLWINDGLMAIFFLLIGLEIKRELRFGELSNPRQAMLPVTAAVGGALVPALLFMSLNAGTPYERGWAIPMATDIAFAVGVLALLGRRIPSWLKIFLLSLAVVDDLIAVLVIAIFYTSTLNWSALGVAALCLAGLVALNLRNVHTLGPYLLLGFVLWVAMLKSGVHATIAGVLLGFAVPATRLIKLPDALRLAEEGVLLFRKSLTEISAEEQKELRETALNQLEDVIVAAESPLHRLEHKLHPYVAFGIMPLFAFANAGVTINLEAIQEAWDSSLTWGIVLGLFLGKQIGIFGSSALLVRAGLTLLPWKPEVLRYLYGASCLAGIGFTMSLFISGLAFGEGELLERSKFGILLASLLSGLMGYAMLRRMAVSEEERPQEEPEAASRT
ncbi:MAG: Na+/H+ antiporter NhaA [Bacteroidetes bacterium]|nr:Na+/H+ antiporter NhaA [Rhodothermia bacterium]MCS7155588.1 Na+/H+ antiporter NhaA [Bacteroidota bacterium]MCX7906446.1 Na+/H+ antiporter NhaA [Bacteroidota bacterium]MDW8137272.1 Na+/H+ antiporter NhaA [Bacteroidota bacterium]MDW8284858.1 Na+/H+ antiporter NhaA [Bacteroidota bacterium]